MKLTPLGDRVVLKQSVAEETTKSGIVLPTQSQEKPQYAEVVEVGPGAVVDGEKVPMEVKAGDKVIYSRYAGTEVKLGENTVDVYDTEYGFRYFDFDNKAVVERIHERNPLAKVFFVSAKTGEGFEEWISWLDNNIKEWIGGTV